MSNWRMSKGLVKSLIRCDECGRHLKEEEFPADEDVCLYCLFPETSGSRPVPINHEQGFPRNMTEERFILDHLDRIPEMQSEAAKKSLERYKNRKLYK